jgi:tetratricopeptide (TPR) repeat protein
MVQNNLGYLLLEKGGDLDEAARLIEASLKQDPKNGSTLDSWGWALFKQGKLKEAEEALRKAVELRPYNPEIRKHLGEVLLKLDRREEALEQWERALAYAFSDRKELEERARKLRVEVARQQQNPGTENAPANPSSKDDEDEYEGDD